MHPNLETRRQSILQTSNQIHEIANGGKPFFFLAGAGISIGSNLPSWKSFISNCVVEAFGKDATVEEVAKIHRVDSSSTWLVEVAANEMSKNIRTAKKIGLLHKALWGKDSKNVRPSRTHYLLVRTAYLYNKPIFTTNFDNLLELAAEEMKIVCPSFATQKELKRICSRKKSLGFSIVHLHGMIPRDLGKSDIESVENTFPVAGEFDYYREYNSRSASNALLIKYFAKETAVILGASLSDPNINRCLLQTAGSNTHAHLWFTRLNAESMYAGQLHTQFWKSLRVSPIYCSYDFREIPAVLRRLSDHKQQIIGTFPKEVIRKIRNHMDGAFKKFHTHPVMQKRMNPWDKIELDLYIDKSDHYALRMDRVWCSPRANGSQPGDRTFKLEWRCNEVLNHTFETIVPDAIDCLSPHYLVRNKDMLHDKASEASGQHAPFRSWAYVSYPIFVPYVGRAIFLFVLKYANQDNWMLTRINDNGLTREITDGINEIGEVLEQLVKNKLRVTIK